MTSLLVHLWCAVSYTRMLQPYTMIVMTSTNHEAVSESIETRPPQVIEALNQLAVNSALGGYGETRVYNPAHPERLMRKIAVLPDGQRDGIMDLAESVYPPKERPFTDLLKGMRRGGRS